MAQMSSPSTFVNASSLSVTELKGTVATAAKSCRKACCNSTYAATSVADMPISVMDPCTKYVGTAVGVVVVVGVGVGEVVVIC